MWWFIGYLMKKLVYLLLSAALITLSIGCATTGSTTGAASAPVLTTNQVQTIARAVQVVASAAVPLAVKKYPGALAYFSAVVPLLDGLLNTGAYDPNAMSSALSAIPVKEVASNDDIKAAIAVALSMYDVTYAQAVSSNLNLKIYAAPILLGLRNGIASGIGAAQVIPPAQPAIPAPAPVAPAPAPVAPAPPVAQ